MGQMPHCNKTLLAGSCPSCHSVFALLPAQDVELHHLMAAGAVVKADCHFHTPSQLFRVTDPAVHLLAHDYQHEDAVSNTLQKSPGLLAPSPIVLLPHLFWWLRFLVSTRTCDWKAFSSQKVSFFPDQTMIISIGSSSKPFQQALGWSIACPQGQPLVSSLAQSMFTLLLSLLNCLHPARWATHQQHHYLLFLRLSKGMSPEPTLTI